MRRLVLGGVTLVVMSAACGGALDPTVEVEDLEFRGEANIVGVGSPDGAAIQASVSVRNVGLVPIARTFDGGCFIRRFQAFHEVEGERRLAWDSARAPGWACTSDQTNLDLAPGEEARPGNWRTGIRLSEIRDSLPAGRYEVVIRIQAGDRTMRPGFVDVS